MQSFSERRARLLSSMHPGVLVVFSTPTAIRNNDVEHEYRQSSDFFYLSGFDEPESVLVLSSVAEKDKFVLFVRPRDPERETWDGRRAGVEGAIKEFGADAAYPISELATRLPELLLGSSELHYALGRHREQDDVLLAALEGARRRGRRGATYPTRISDAEVLLHEQRLFKTPEELDIMRRAARISGEAHVAAMKSAKPGVNECEIDALFRGIFRKHGCERPAYEPIVGSGPNATILHYRRNNRDLQDGDLLLIDAGCELEYYASDVTRTFPVNGRFSPEQRAIYDIVLESQERAIATAKAGATLDEVHVASAEVITRGLIALGLIEGPLEAWIAETSVSVNIALLGVLRPFAGVGFELGAVDAAGTGLPAQVQAQRPWRAASAGLGLRLETEGFFLQLGGSLLVPLSRQRYLLSDPLGDVRTVYEVPSMGLKQETSLGVFL